MLPSLPSDRSLLAGVDLACLPHPARHLADLAFCCVDDVLRVRGVSPRVRSRPRRRCSAPRRPCAGRGLHFGALVLREGARRFHRSVALLAEHAISIRERGRPTAAPRAMAIAPATSDLSSISVSRPLGMRGSSQRSDVEINSQAARALPTPCRRTRAESSTLSDGARHRRRVVAERPRLYPRHAANTYRCRPLY